MTISAVSLRDSNSYKVNTNKAQSFGKRSRMDDSDNNMKNRKAAGIAIAVGLTAAAAILAYAFRGKIANIPFVKETFQKGQSVVDFASKQGEKFVKKGQEFAGEAKVVIQNAGEKAKGVAGETVKKTVEIKDEVVKKASELVDEAGKLVKKVKKGASKRVAKK